MRVDLPDVNFVIGVQYTGDMESYGSAPRWEITISLGGISLISRSYKGDYTAAREFQKTYGELPMWYASDEEDAKKKTITEFGKTLKDALSAGSANKPLA